MRHDPEMMWQDGRRFYRHRAPGERLSSLDMEEIDPPEGMRGVVAAASALLIFDGWKLSGLTVTTPRWSDRLPCIYYRGAHPVDLERMHWQGEEPLYTLPPVDVEKALRAALAPPVVAFWGLTEPPKLTARQANYVAKIAADELATLKPPTDPVRFGPAFCRMKVGKVARAIFGFSLAGALPAAWVREQITERATNMSLDAAEIRDVLTAAWSEARPRKIPR